MPQPQLADHQTAQFPPGTPDQVPLTPQLNIIHEALEGGSFECLWKLGNISAIRGKSWMRSTILMPTVSDCK